MIIRRAAHGLALAIAGACCSCDDSRPTARTDARLSVYAGIAPAAYFVERVGGRFVDVSVLLGPGDSPATFEPTPAQMIRLATSKAYFAMGVPFEKRLSAKIKKTMPQVRIVNLNPNVADHDDDHGHDHGHDHGDAHVWLDPPLVKDLARSARDALSQLDPNHTDAFDANLKAFEADLDALHEKIARQLAPYRGRSFLAYHPSYGHFAGAYGLHQIAIEQDGKEPRAQQLTHLVTQAKKDNIRVIFVQPQFSGKSARTLAEAIGATVVTLDPLARDYISNMEEMASKIASALGKTRLASTHNPPGSR
jgi:zinc transport system substrate-binding protein